MSQLVYQDFWACGVNNIEISMESWTKNAWNNFILSVLQEITLMWFLQTLMIEEFNLQPNLKLRWSSQACAASGREIMQNRGSCVAQIVAQVAA